MESRLILDLQINKLKNKINFIYPEGWINNIPVASKYINTQPPLFENDFQAAPILICPVALMAKVNASPKKKTQAKLNTTGQLMAPPADPSVNAPRKFSGFTGTLLFFVTNKKKGS